MRSHAIIAASIVISSCFCGAGDCGELPLRFNEVTARALDPGSSFLASDVDHDGNDELLIDNGRWLVWLRLKGSVFLSVMQGNYAAPGSTVGLGDANGDGRPEFFVLMDTPAGKIMAGHDWFSKRGPSAEFFRFGPVLPPGRHHDAGGEGTIYFLGCHDADGDGTPEIYIGVTPYHALPDRRTVRVFNGSTRRELWHFDMGPIATYSFIAHTRDGPRIVISSFGPNNGASWNGTVDSLSYVFSFRPGGTEHWARAIAGPHTWTCVDTADVDGDGYQEIVVGKYLAGRGTAGAAEADRWTVGIFNPADLGVIRTSDLGTGVSVLKCVDIDGDRKPEILAVGMDGAFYILNRDLSVRRACRDRIHVTPGDLTICGVRDLDGDGRQEIVLEGSSGVLVRAANGDLIAEQPASWRYQVQLARVEDRQYIILQGQGDSVAHFYTLVDEASEARRRSVSAPGEGYHAILSRTYALPVALLLLLLIAGAFALRARRRPLENLDDARVNLFMARREFRHGGSLDKILERLGSSFEAWVGEPGAVPGDGEALRQPIVDFTTSVRQDLVRIAGLAQAARVPGSLWKPLFSSVSAVETRLGRLMAGADGGSLIDREIVREAIGDLEKTNRCLTGIDEWLNDYYRTRAVATIERVFGRRAEELANARIAWEIVARGAERADVLVSRTVFEKAIDALLVNSMRAVERAASPRIAATVIHEGGSCRIKMRDNGRGIERDKWDRVFDLDYSTKEAGGGLGLHYAKTELAKFGGHIFVSWSEVGAGTEMSVVLTIARPHSQEVT